MVEPVVSDDMIEAGKKELWNRFGIRSGPEPLRASYIAMHQAHQVQHVGKYVEETGLIDLWECSCGWVSHPYYDGADLAEREWKQHQSSENKPRN